MKKFLKILIIFIICIGNFGAIYEIDATRNATTHNNMGVNYLNEKNYYSAIKEFEMAIMLNPNTQATATYYNNLGKTYMQIGYPKMAEESFNKALEKNATNFEFYQNIVNSYKAQGKLQTELEKAMVNNNPLSKVTAGLILIEMEKKEAGINMLDEFCFDEPKMIITKGIMNYIQSLSPNEFRF